MTLPVPSELTANVGDLLAAANWNSNVRDAINFLLNRPLLIMYQNTAQSIPNGAWTQILPDTVGYDPYSMWSAASHVPFVPVSGYYRAVCRPSFTANATGARGSGLAWNSVSITGSSQNWAPGLSSQSGVECTSVNYLTAGQYVRFMCYQNSGAALTMQTGVSEFSLQWIHA